MWFHTDKCTFLHKMPFPAEKCTFPRKKKADFGVRMAGNTGSCRSVSGLKTQESWPTFTRYLQDVSDYFREVSDYFQRFQKGVGKRGLATSIVRCLLGTGPPDPTLNSASPSPAQGSIWHQFDIDLTLIRHRNRVKSGNQYRINVESMPNRPLRRGGRGAQMLVFFSRILRALTEVWGRAICANDPRMSAGYPSPKLPL